MLMTAHKSLKQNLNNQLWNNFSPSNRMELAQGVVGFLKNHDRLDNDTVEMLNFQITSSCLEKVYPFFHMRILTSKRMVKDICKTIYRGLAAMGAETPMY